MAILSHVGENLVSESIWTGLDLPPFQILELSLEVPYLPALVFGHAGLVYRGFSVSCLWFSVSP